jgi:hypothetical protein
MMRRATGLGRLPGAVLLGALAILLVADPTRADDAQTLQRAVAYTLSVQRDDFMAAAPSGQDNVVRQAGALYALGEYLLHTDDPAVAESLRRGLERMQALSRPSGKSRFQSWLERTGLYAWESGRLEKLLLRHGLLYRPEGEGSVLVEPGAGYEQGWAGGTALALAAELAYARATGDDGFAGARARWRRGLLDQLVPGGAVRATPATLKHAIYFDGETWLALALYHEAFPQDAEVGDALHRLEDFLMSWYGGEGRHRHFFHWGEMACAVRQRTDGDRDPRFARFAAELADWYLDQVSLEETKSHTTCSVIEGAASALAVLGPEKEADPLVVRLRERVTRELERNGKMQIRAGQDRIELPKGGLLVAPTLAGHAGATLAGPYRAYTRIDLTQHCISGWVKALRVGVATGALPRPDLPIGPLAEGP